MISERDEVIANWVYDRMLSELREAMNEGLSEEHILIDFLNDKFTMKEVMEWLSQRVEGD